MASITFRPDLKTSGGEVTELLLNGKYAGSITLVYREGHRLSGAVQLDRQSLSGKRKAAAVRAAQTYVQQMMDALQANECEVIVTCSPYDHIIASEQNVGTIREFVGEPADYADGSMNGDDEEDEANLDDIDPNDRDTLEMSAAGVRGPLRDPRYYELVIVGESRNRVEYHIYDRDREWIAEAFLRIRGSDVSGEVRFVYEPLEQELEQVADLIVSDFDPEAVDTFRLDMMHDGTVLETIELTRDDLLEGNERNRIETVARGDEREYRVVLVRDDGDALTYDIYKRSHGRLPIGTATVDISRHQLTGFIDFRDKGSCCDREHIASLLMQELDKEKDYESIHLTMQYQNKPIDEVLFETETVH